MGKNVFPIEEQKLRPWNDLPADTVDTKQATSLNSFKKSIWTFSFSFILDFINLVLGFILWFLYCNFGFLFGYCMLYIVSSLLSGGPF